MIKTEIKPYGFKIIFEGNINKLETEKWYQEVKILLTKTKKDFSVIIDMKKMTILQLDAKPIMVTAQKLFKSSGMARSAVIVANPILKLQFETLGKITKISEFERYIDASKFSNPDNVALNWISKNIEPKPDVEIPNWVYDK
jgi:hypothetical protein